MLTFHIKKTAPVFRCISNWNFTKPIPKRKKRVTAFEYDFRQKLYWSLCRAREKKTILKINFVGCHKVAGNFYRESLSDKFRLM